MQLIIIIISCAIAATVTGTALAHAFSVHSGDSMASRLTAKTTNAERSFTIDFENDTFLKDGEPFRYVSGSFHYFRAIPEKWSQILKNMRAGGLNAVDM